MHDVKAATLVIRLSITRGNSSMTKESAYICGRNKQENTMRIIKGIRMSAWKDLA